MAEWRLGHALGPDIGVPAAVNSVASLKAAHGALPEVDISDQDKRRTMLLDDGQWSPTPCERSQQIEADPNPLCRLANH
jgi:hypothetical protein